MSTQVRSAIQTKAKTVIPRGASENGMRLDRGYDSSTLASASRKKLKISEMTRSARTLRMVRDRIQVQKLSELEVLPPQILLDKNTIYDYEQVLKTGLSGDLLDLGDDCSEFNLALTGLLACRRIPSGQHEAFLSLRRELPDLIHRASELHKGAIGLRGLVQGIKMPNGWTKEMDIVKSHMDRLSKIGNNLLRLEHQRHLALQPRAEPVEIAKMARQIEAIDEKIVSLKAERWEMQQDADTHRLIEAQRKEFEALFKAQAQCCRDDLVIMERQWRDRVAAFEYY